MIRWPILNDKEKLPMIIRELYKDFKKGTDDAAVIQKYSADYQEEEIDKILDTFKKLPLGFKETVYYKIIKYGSWIFLVLGIWPTFLNILDIVLLKGNALAFILWPLGFLIPALSLLLLKKESENVFYHILFLWGITFFLGGTVFLNPGFLSFTSPVESFTSMINILLVSIKLMIIFSAGKLFAQYNDPILLRINKIVADIDVT